MPEKKNIIYIGTSPTVWRETARVLLKKYNWTPKLYVGFEDTAPNNPKDIFYGVPFYSLNEARLGEYPRRIDDFKKGPYDVQLIADLQNDFDSFIELIERFVITRHNGSYEQKKNFFMHLIRIWNGFLEMYDISAVVMISRPHRMFDFVLEALCRHKGIPAIMLDEIDLNACCYAVDFSKSLSVLDEKKETLRNFDGIISEEAEKYLNRMRRSYDEGKPVSVSAKGFFSKKRQKQQKQLYFKIKNNLPPEIALGWAFLKALISGRLRTKYKTVIRFSQTDRYDPLPKEGLAIDIILQEYQRKHQIRNAEKFYNNHAVKPDLTKKYIYFTACFQPERSTCPDAGRYHDLLLSLNLISKSVGDDVIIYFKEHPRTFVQPADIDAQRSIIFFKQLLEKCSNVKLIDNSYTPFELIDNAYAIAMPSGTTGWESVVRGKPCLLFGDRWYKDCPGVFYVQSRQDVARALQDIETFKYNPKSFNQFIEAIETYSDKMHYYFYENVKFRQSLQKHPFNDHEPTEEDKYYAELGARHIIRAAMQGE